MSVFESEACRVWTGALGAPLHAIEDAEQHELDVVPCSIQIWINTHCSVESGDVQSIKQRGLYLARSPTSDDYLKVFPRNVKGVADDVSEAFGSPSPFVSSVLAVLDVDDRWQQGYFFGRVRRVAVRSDRLVQNKDSRSDAFLDTEVAEELLVALHAAFPKVPLSSSAKECLAKQSASRDTSRNKIGEMVKRRKTLTAEAFYGTKALKPAPIDLYDPSTVRASNSWRMFYEKLQFRVSHSLMCQLEGTAPISSSFPRQQEAFEFADQVATFRRRLRSTQNPAKVSECSADGAPRVFSFESAGDGKRRFLVASFAEFWKNYQKTRADQRHVYEIIREGVPCRLYFDLEFKRNLNPHVDGEALVTRLVSLLQLQLYRMYGLRVRHQDIYQLDSSTSAKFSRHLIFHFSQGYLFADNIHAGAFVREFISDLVISSDDTIEDASDHFYTPLLVNTESVDDPVENKQLFIDTGVYTRNRMFRVMGSSKHKKQAILRPLGASPSAPIELNEELFINTLVCPYPSLEVLQRHQQIKSCCLLRCELSPSGLGRSRRFTSGISSFKNLATSSVECRKSIFPTLDAFIRSQAITGGVQGEIRAIQMLMASSGVVLTVLPGQEQDQNKIEAEAKKPPCPWMIIYHMARNRWCANIRRPHKSNNVMFIVDIDQRVFYQKCHDPTCQAMDFRSPPQPLPPHITVDKEISEMASPS